MSFAAPELLILLVVVAVMGVMAYRLARWRMGARTAFAGPQASRWRDTFSLAATVFVLEAAALIVIAIARPVWGSKELTRERQGVDVVFVLDISASMQAADVLYGVTQQEQGISTLMSVRLADADEFEPLEPEHQNGHANGTANRELAEVGV